MNILRYINRISLCSSELQRLRVTQEPLSRYNKLAKTLRLNISINTAFYTKMQSDEYLENF